MDRALTYDDIHLVPKQKSTIRHRSEVDTSTKFCSANLDIPIIAAPMPDVCNGEMASILSGLGALGIIHRFQTIQNRVIEYNYAIAAGMTPERIGVAIGLDEAKNIDLFPSNQIFCIDIANGFSSSIEELVSFIKSEYPGIFIIAGNVASPEGYKFLADLGVHAVRVGIAGGSVCETRNETGVYYPMASCVMEIVASKTMVDNPPLIIADGGIRKPADMCKALALGADAVMCGSIFAGTSESPGEVIKHNGQLVKLYRGAASFSVQQQHKNETPEYNEGNETLVPYKGHVRKVIQRYKAGLQSSMSYMNARNLDEFRKNACFVTS